MPSLFTRLKQRNPLLYYFGWLNLLAAFGCLVMTQADNTMVLGINAWIKPAKFFLSSFIFVWTMAWILVHLEKPRAVKAYSIMVVIVLAFELYVIAWQAANGRLSHFNTTNRFYLLLFNLMGIAISILAVWTAYIGYLFFRKRQFTISPAYMWGIRLGILFFVLFSFEGALMAANLSHTIGAPDGGPGLPVVNWSTQYGDLRIAHFAGMHALQVLPLAGYFVFRRPAGLILFSTIYFAGVVALIVMALNGIPLFNY